MGTSDAWGDGFRRLGQDAIDVPLRIGQLEEAWWKEHGGKGPMPDSDTVTKAVLLQVSPDILIVEGLERYSVAEIDRFRLWLPKLSLLIGTSGNEINDAEIFRPLDLFLSIRPKLVEMAKAAGRPAFRVPTGFDDRVLPLIGPVAKTQDFVFSGQVHGGEKYHDRRRAILEEVLASVKGAVYSDTNLSLAKALPEFLTKVGAWAAARMLDGVGIPLEKLPGARQLQAARSWDRPPRLTWSPTLARASRPAVFGLDMFRTLASARLTINVQPGLADKYATNMRLFEATGAGACLVTDTADDIRDFFAEDEIVTFDSAEEAVEKVKYLVAHPNDAAAIADHGQAKTLRDHTYAKRMGLVLEHMNAIEKIHK